MNENSKIYTKGGDKGQTSLASGERISKGDKQIDLYGEVDELNSYIGLSKFYSEKNGLESDILLSLKKIQAILFDLGSQLASAPEKREKLKLEPLKDEDIEEIEKMIDCYSSKMPALRSFIHPGGSEVSCYFHLCRTIARRVERKLVDFELSHCDFCPPNALKFLNRLSDFFFILARYGNFREKREDVKW